jgi:hypothetical protein
MGQPTAMRKLFVLAALACSFGEPIAAQPNVDARFGILVVAQDGSQRFVETRQVPNVVGQSYGWVARVEPRSESVSWSEELTLPTAPRVWGAAQGSPGVAVSDDRGTALTRGTLPAGGTELFHFWGVAPGDPSGTYRIVVKLSDGVVAEFEFEVVDPPPR